MVRRHIESLEARRLLSLGAADPTYGINGQAYLGSPSTGTTYAAAPDGTIFISDQGSGRVEHFDVNGKADLQFGPAGTGIISMSTSLMASTSNDGLVAIISLTNPATGKSAAAIARLKPNGTFDPTFGSGGSTFLPFDAPGVAYKKLISLGDGSTLLAASTAYPNDRVLIARFTPNGTFDPTLNGIGYRILDETGPLALVQTAAVQPDGKILVLLQSTASITQNQPSTLLRLRTDGSLDPSFADAGELSFDDSGPEIRGIAVRPDGRIVATVLGITTGLSSVYQYLPDGSLDPSFGVGGIAPVSVNFSAFTDVLVRPDGTLRLGGGWFRGGPVSGSGNATAAMNATGQLFPAYGQSGISLTPHTIGSAGGLVLQPDGSLLQIISEPGVLFAIRLEDLAPGSGSGLSSVSGHLYNDANKNGQQDSNEQALASGGIQLFLDKNDNGVLDAGEAVTTTAADGTYTFAGVSAGTYTLRFVSGPANFVQTEPQSGGARVVPVGAGQSIVGQDFGFCALPVTMASVSGRVGAYDTGAPLAGFTVWFDVNNNSLHDPGEPVSIADADGNWQFNNVTAGPHFFCVAAPGWGFNTGNGPVPLDFWPLNVQSGQQITHVTLYLLNHPTITGTVWDVAAGFGAQVIVGRSIYIDSNNNGTLDAGEESVQSGVNGVYQIADLSPGPFVVRQVLPAGWQQTSPNLNATEYLLEAGDIHQDFKSSSVHTGSSITGLLFKDLNFNGILDAGEPLLTGHIVYLDANNNGILDPTESSVVTDSFNGNYSFTVAPGNYTVRQVLNRHWSESDITGNGVNVTVSAGQIANVDFGSLPSSQVPATASGIVFADANQNGALDPSETGLPGITVFLDANGDGQVNNSERTAITDATGAFVFHGVPPGEYLVRPVVLAGWKLTGLPYVDQIFGPGDNVSDFKFGLQGPPRASLGGPYSVTEGASINLSGSGSSEVGGTIAKYEWDTNYNGTTFVARATGVTTSFSAAGLDGPGSRAIALRVTDGNNATAIATGSVTINNAPPKATFGSGGAVTLGAPGSVSFSGASDPSPADVTAGFKYSYDFANNGTFETVNSATASATVPATYLAIIGAHTIHGRIIDKDGDYTDYTTSIQVNTANVGKGSIAGQLFIDANANGALDAGEKPISGRVVFIDTNKNGKLDAGEVSTTTAVSGTFTFKNLTAGTYRIADVLPTGWRRTAPAAGYFDMILTAGQTASGKNFAETQNVLIAGAIYNDANGNARQDTGEKGIAARTVYIDKNKNGKFDVGEPSTLTAADGSYSFKTLIAGSYRVRQVLPTGSRVTNPTAGYYDLTLTAGQSATGKVFADTTTALISGIVFKDTNANAKQDAGELGLSGWVVYLDTNNNGKLDAGEKSFTTGADGKFTFAVPAGTYHLREVLKSGFTRTTPAGGLYTVTLTSGQAVTGKIFGDK